MHWTKVAKVISVMRLTKVARVMRITRVYWAILGSAGLWWAVVGCGGLYWTVLVFTRLNWAVVCCSRLNCCVLGCNGRSQQLFVCVFSHFSVYYAIFGMVTNTHPTWQPGDPRASLLLTSGKAVFYKKFHTCGGPPNHAYLQHVWNNPLVAIELFSQKMFHLVGAKISFEARVFWNEKYSLFFIISICGNIHINMKYKKLFLPIYSLKK